MKNEVQRSAISLVGPPGSGKGRYSLEISKDIGAEVISVRKMLISGYLTNTRENQKTIASGNLLADSVVIAAVKQYSSASEPFRVVVFDGIPRNVAQAEMLDGFLRESQIDRYYAVFLDADDDWVLEDLSNRVVCTGCGRSFNIVNRMPRNLKSCDSCGFSLTHRSDDQREILIRRLQEYRINEFRLRRYYEMTNRIMEVKVPLREENYTEWVRSLSRQLTLDADR